MEAARSMLAGSTLPKSFWAETVLTANHVINRIDNESSKSPFEKFHNEKPRLNNLHEFGSDVYMMMPYEKRRKLDDKVIKMKFIGYDDMAKGYRLVDINYKIHISREVKFLDTMEKFTRKQTRKTYDEKNQQENLELENVENKYTEVFFQDKQTTDTGNIVVELEEENVFYDAEEGESEDENEQIDDLEVQEEPGLEAEPDEPQQVRRSARQNFGQRPDYLNDYVTNIVEEKFKVTEPRSHQEAFNSPHSRKWKLAMQEELNSIEENDTWKLVDLPCGRKAIGSKWVFKLKRDVDGNIVRHKARLVAQGFTQKFGIDYDEVFAPVARSQTLRLLLSVAGTRNYHVKQYDIKSAFLNGKLEE